MRRKQPFKRSRLIPIVVAGFAGYVLGGLSAPAVRTADAPAVAVAAQRFPQERFPKDWTATSSQTTATITPVIADAARIALMSPVPLAPQAPAPQVPGPAVEHATVAPAAAQAPPRTARVAEAKPVAPAPVFRRSDRPGYMLNDAQIASIKERLHLTADQQEMWPAVEGALRNLASAKARDAHRLGAAGPSQVATADADSAEVQDLKSAAIPLLMSFNSEQKDEVRSLAHVMGLDELATQF